MSAIPLTSHLPQDIPPPNDAWSHIAYLRVSRRAGSGDILNSAAAEQLIACWYQLSSRVELVSAHAALLDLGPCTEKEALAAVGGLLDRLRALGLQARSGIGPSGVVAQLAVLLSPRGRDTTYVTPTAAPSLLRRTPVDLLIRLHPGDLLPPETVQRLHRYGLRTLGHVACIGELALRRQFGMATGAALAALSHGQDVRPLRPTPPPDRLRVRERFATPATPQEALATVPHLARLVSDRLRERGRHPRTLHLAIRREGGGVARARLALRQPTNDTGTLTRALQRLLTSLLPLAAWEDRGGHPDELRLDEVRVEAGDCAPAYPQQEAFWRTSGQRADALELAGDALTRRHGRPLLLRPQLAEPAAIFPEERYRFADAARPTELLVPTGTDGALIPVHIPVRIQARSLKRPATARATTPDPWQRVPVRLHWW